MSLPATIDEGHFDFGRVGVQIVRPKTRSPRSKDHSGNKGVADFSGHPAIGSEVNRDARRYRKSHARGRRENDQCLLHDTTHSPTPPQQKSSRSKSISRPLLKKEPARIS